MNWLECDGGNLLEIIIVVGNYCPICHKCYSDDDWDSKMVQCASCESWVHAKCEELTGKSDVSGLILSQLNYNVSLYIIFFVVKKNLKGRSLS